MAMKPLAEILQLLHSTDGRSFADRHPDQDLVLIEPYEAGREYGPTSPLHQRGQVRFVPRTPGKPVPVGRDSRSFVLLDHPAVSRLHVVIAFTLEQGWKVMDRSSNGSYINDERMPGQTAIPLPYGLPIRMGRALMLRVFRLEEFLSYARSGAQPGGAPAAAAPPDRQADTWRLPAVPPPPPARQFGGNELSADFEFPAGPPPFQPAAPTQRFRVGSGRVAQPPTASPPVPPAPPKPPAPPPKRVSEDDLEFEFDFDFDGKGGFA